MSKVNGRLVLVFCFPLKLVCYKDIIQIQFSSKDFRFEWNFYVGPIIDLCSPFLICYHSFGHKGHSSARAKRFVER